MNLLDRRVIVRVRNNFTEPSLVAVIAHLHNDTGGANVTHRVSYKANIANQMALILVMVLLTLEDFFEQIKLILFVWFDHLAYWIIKHTNDVNLAPEVLKLDKICTAVFCGDRQLLIYFGLFDQVALCVL